MKTTYCSIIDNTSIAHFFAMRSSILSFDKEAIFYLLCLSSHTYKIIEDMQLHNVYMIHIDELEKMDHSLLNIKERIAPQVYISLLHINLLEYIVFFNPLIKKIIYVAPYCFCLSNISTILQEDDFYCFKNNSNRPSPLCIVVHASDKSKEILSEYKKEYYFWAEHTKATLENASEPLITILEKYSIELNSAYCILSEARPHNIEYNNALFLENSELLFLYTKDIVPISKRIYSSQYPFTFKSNYILMKYAIKNFLDSLRKAFYRVHIFSAKKEKKRWKNSIKIIFLQRKSRNFLGKQYYFCVI